MRKAEWGEAAEPPFYRITAKFKISYFFFNGLVLLSREFPVYFEAQSQNMVSSDHK